MSIYRKFKNINVQAQVLLLLSMNAALHLHAVEAQAPIALPIEKTAAMATNKPPENPTEKIAVKLPETAAVNLVAKQASNAPPPTSFASKKLPLSLKQSIDIAISTEDIISRYKFSAYRQFTLVAFHQTKGLKEEDELKHIVGGGIETPFLTLGNFYEHGLFRNFKDVSDTQAWNSAVYQYTRWSIRRDPVSSPDLGLLLSVPTLPFSLQRPSRNDAIASMWIAAIPLDDEVGFADMSLNAYGLVSEERNKYNLHLKPANYHSGANLGYKFGVWEPRLVYKHSWRNELPLQSTNWDSWTITEPTALRLHQIQLAQRVTVGRTLLAELIGMLSASDTIKNRYSGKALVRLTLNKLELGIQLALAEANSITDEWKYSKYLWNSSAEILYWYRKASKLKFRVNIAEYNPTRESKNISLPQSLRRSYSLLWSHRFEISLAKNGTNNNTKKLNKKKTLGIEPELEYDYIYTIDDELHRSTFETGVYYHTWKHALRARIDWYIDEKSRGLDKIDISNSLYTHYTLPSVPIKLWTRLSTVHIRDMEKHYADDDDIVNDILEDITSDVGIRFYQHGFSASLSVSYNFTEDSSVRDIKAFKHEYLVEAKFQYTW